MFDKKQLDLFFYTADERHIIYMKKEAGEPKESWTKDEIFKNWRFCNVYRKLDKVTKYIINKWIKPYDVVPIVSPNYYVNTLYYEPYFDLYKLIFIARFFSKIETLKWIKKEIGLMPLFDISNYKNICLELLKLQKKQPIMTNAFMLCSFKYKGGVLPKLYTPFHLINLIEKNGFFKMRIHRLSIELLTHYFKTLHLCGGFMAYEYATDLTYCHTYYPKKAPDYYTYCNIGQGSLRGLHRLLGQSATKDPIKNWRELTIELLKLWNEHIKRTGILFLDENNSLSMREVEHWLCEFDKYMRIYNGETSRLKRRYI